MRVGRCGVWHEVVIPISALALTYQGQLVERKLEFQADKVIGVGVSVSAALPAADSSSTRLNDPSSDGSMGTAAGSGLSIDTAVPSQQQQEQQDRVAHAELFRMYVREIRAEGEM